MHLTSIEPTKENADRKYMSHTSIVQSSGSCKSRLVDEVAKDVSTVPFKIREARDATSESIASLTAECDLIVH